MDKAYELKALGQYIKEEAAKDGLELAEQTLEVLAKSVYFGTKRWMKESAPLSETKIDDFIAPFYDNADPYVIPQIEKIDLNKDGK